VSEDWLRIVGVGFDGSRCLLCRLPNRARTKDRGLGVRMGFNMESEVVALWLPVKPEVITSELFPVTWKVWEESWPGRFGERDDEDIMKRTYNCTLRLYQAEPWFPEASESPLVAAPSFGFM
jgi:hypothetical protein